MLRVQGVPGIYAWSTGCIRKLYLEYRGYQETMPRVQSIPETMPVPRKLILPENQPYIQPDKVADDDHI